MLVALYTCPVPPALWAAEPHFLSDHRAPKERNYPVAMSTLWTDKGARAVIPSATLLNGKEPILATYRSTADSPQPLGVGVNVVFSNGNRRALPLFFVSPHAVKSLGEKAGWYVVADMGQRFEIVDTNVHMQGAVSVIGALLTLTQVAASKLEVDGTPVMLQDIQVY